MNALNEYPLKYTHIESEVEFRGKTAIPGEEWIIFNHLTGEKERYTKYRLRKLFKSSKENCHAAEHKWRNPRSRKRFKSKDWLNEMDDCEEYLIRA